jgi:hypothetical protein
MVWNFRLQGIGCITARCKEPLGIPLGCRYACRAMYVVPRSTVKFEVLDRIQRTRLF